MIKLKIDWAANLVLAVLFYLITDYISYKGAGAILSVCLALSVMALFLKNEIKGFHLLIYLLLLSPDHPRNLIEDLDVLKEVGGMNYYSFITTKVMGISLSVWSILVVGFLAVTKGIINNELKVSRSSSKLLICILVVLISILLSTFFDLPSRNIVDAKFIFSDVKIFLMLMLGVFIAESYIRKNPYYISDFMTVMVNISVIIGLKTLFFVVSDLILLTPKLMLATQPYIFIALVFAYLTLKVKNTYVLMALAILASIKISRGEIAYIMMEILMMILVIALIYKNSAVDVVRMYLKNAFVGMFFIAVPVTLMAHYNEYLFNFLVYKFRFFTTEIWDGNVAYSASTRMYEFLNIVAFQIENVRALLIGRGLGGHFDFTFYPLGYSLGLSDFSAKELEMGAYFKPHFFINYVLLKLGVLGLIAYLALCLSFAFQGYKLSVNSEGIKKLFGVYTIYMCIYSFNMFWQPVLMFICAVSLTFLLAENRSR